MVVGAMAMVMYELFSWIEKTHHRAGAPGLARRVSFARAVFKTQRNATQRLSIKR